uniref:TATA box-binding protein-like 1 n=1 Tax=Poecilia mexicana TaxID=48701 RepID=A0A3B3XEI9_9TELE
CKINCTGFEEEAKLGARRLARCLQKLGFKVRFSAFRVVNVLAVCSMPFAVHLVDFTKNNRPIASYEPELHPAATYRIKNLKATVQVFSTGSLTVTGMLLSHHHTHTHTHTPTFLAVLYLQLEGTQA